MTDARHGYRGFVYDVDREDEGDRYTFWHEARNIETGKFVFHLSGKSYDPMISEESFKEQIDGHLELMEG